MNFSVATFFTVMFCIFVQTMFLVDAKPHAQNNFDGRPKRSIMNSYGNADGPIVLNHLLKQPILSFGPWFAPSRAKRFNGNVDYADLDAFYPQPITQRRLRRNLRQHKRMLLSL
ncbi:hypothetical protein M3Y97_00782200 [Aphelenchoides bicaudatus]|nr:hypothetical protein M3Y97_00782200 [Aphelenchoides bicaudatus]